MATRAAVILFLVSSGFVYGQEEETILKVVPHGIAVEPGETITMICKHYPEDLAADANLDWFLPDGTGPISLLVTNQSVITTTNSNILRFSSENGTLTIVNSTENDSGKYLCKQSDSDLEVEAEIKVFVMPTYFTESMIVLSINAALVIIFLACSAWTFVRNRREAQKRKREQRLGHKELLKRILE